ncbi:hypothetical protein BDM02DRAFT_3183979 [Thelephora ganbajun]|uniref:Uncharacterized protein n=1 Tax=Thelephora ganbajun TaxID=370292 RepID=A0ACB6ZQM8_THEGA|nr:hypothetical protein BDM02DRAFT_3183979 [Thelephora ganbajun]
MCINCVIRQEQEEDEKRQALKKKGDQGLPVDPETTQEDFPNDEWKTVVEPQPERDPSARDDFHQAYTKKLQAADKDVEDYSRTLDSFSYPALLSSAIILLLIDCETEPCLTRFYGISTAVAVISLSLFTKQYLKHHSSQQHRSLFNTKRRGSSKGFTWLTEGGVPLVALAVLSPFLLSQILSKTGQSFQATLSVVTAAFLVLGFMLVWGPALLHTLITKAFRLRASSRIPRHSPPTPPPLFKQEVASFSSAPGGEETLDSTASLTVMPLLNPVGVDHQGNLTDARRLAWVLERSSDPQTISAILRFILEILWTPDHLQDADSSNSTLVRSYELLSEVFDSDYATQPALLRGTRGQALAAAKAFVHIFIQGNYAPDELVISTLRDRHVPLGSSPSLKDDADLRSVVGIVDNLLGVRKPIQWSELQLTSSHRLWLSHILLYRAWYATKHGLQVPDDVIGFVKHSLSSDPRPRLAVVTDCVLVVGLIVGYPLHEADLLVWEKTQELPTVLQKVLDKLKVTFGPTSTRADIEVGLQGLELFSPLCLHPVVDGCHGLFNVVMESGHLTGETKWKAARLALYGAYKWDLYMPWLHDAKNVVAFFEHILEFPSAEEEQDMALESAYRALAYASKREMLDQYDMTKRLVVDGTVATFSQQKPFQLWKAILFFLDVVEGQWFNSGAEIMNEEKRRELIQKLVDNLEHIEPTIDVLCAILSILFGMANSPMWRPLLPIKLWSAMGGFPALPETTPSFVRCRNNPDVIDGLRAYEEKSVVKFWMGILWRDWVDLRPEVQARLVEVTGEVVGPGAEDQALISAAIVGTHQELSQDMAKFQPWSIEEEALACRARLEKLEQGRLKLEGVLVGVSGKGLP